MKGRPLKMISLDSPEFKRVVKLINSVGLGGMHRISISQQTTNQVELVNKYSGLLINVEMGNGKIIYTFINGETDKVTSYPEDRVELFCWRKLIEPNQQYQFVPINDNGKLVIQPGSIAKIIKVEQEEFQKIVSRYLGVQKSLEKYSE